MTFDPATAVLGADLGAELGGDLGHHGGDAGDLRGVARRQWTARRDLERRLHDGAALRLSALALQLGLLRHGHPGDGRDLGAAVEELQEGLHQVLQELRDVAGLLYPPLLAEAGLGPALREAVARCAVPVRIDAPPERFGAAVEGVAYFALLGCLPGAAPAGDPGVDVLIHRDGEDLVLLVHGVDACHAGPIDDGVRLLGGTVTVGEPGDDPARDTVRSGRGPITVRIPCA